MFFIIIIIIIITIIIAISGGIPSAPKKSVGPVNGCGVQLWINQNSSTELVNE